MYNKSIFKQKNYWIGVGVGIATVLIYQKFFKKEKTSSADGDRYGENIYGQGACSSPDDSKCSSYCEEQNGTFDTNNRKCYINGIAYTGGYFSGGKNRSKLQR
jgi:hypothetical protein